MMSFRALALLLFGLGGAAAALLLHLLFGGSGPMRAPIKGAAPPCTATACPGVPATHLAPAALWDVKGDGATDDAAALSAACSFTASHHLELLLTGISRAASPVRCPGGHIRGVGFAADNPIDAPGIRCELAVTVCLQIVPNGTGSVFIENIQVGRAAGVIPAGAIGIQVVGGANVVFRDVISYRHDQCWDFAPPPQPSVAGYTAHLERGFTFSCQDAYFVIDTWPEVALHAIRAGFTNYPDFNANAIFRLTGGPAGCPTGAGPNTVRVSDSHIGVFSDASGNPAVVDSLWQFKKIKDPCQNVGLFTFLGGHVEEVRHLITSDASATAIDILRFVHSSWVGGINDQGTSWIALDPATQILRWTIADDDVYFWNQKPNCICLSPNLPIEGLTLDDLRFYGRGMNNQPQAGPVNVTIAAPAGSWGRISGLDMLAGGVISVTGPGAAGFHIEGTFTP